MRSLEVLEDELHLVDATNAVLAGALQLLPFVVLRPAPQSEETACYFYSRIGSHGPEFVSHHYKGEHSIAQPDISVAEILEDLKTP